MTLEKSSSARGLPPPLPSLSFGDRPASQCFTTASSLSSLTALCTFPRLPFVDALSAPPLNTKRMEVDKRKLNSLKRHRQERFFPLFSVGESCAHFRRANPLLFLFRLPCSHCVFIRLIFFISFIPFSCFSPCCFRLLFLPRASLHLPHIQPSSLLIERPCRTESCVPSLRRCVSWDTPVSSAWSPSGRQTWSSSRTASIGSSSATSPLPRSTTTSCTSPTVSFSLNKSARRP